MNDSIAFYMSALRLLESIEVPSTAGHEERQKAAAVDAIRIALDVAQARTRPVMRGPANAKVNLGAGTSWSKEGWVALDKYHTGQGDNVIVGDLLHRDLPRVFDRNSVVAIFSSHMFEHFTFAEANEILRDCYNVLKPGGAIRIVTPDLDIAVERFYKRDRDWWSDNAIQKPRPRHLTTDLEMSWSFLRTIGVQMNPKYNQRTLREVIRGYHYSAYNFDIMKKLLENAGFVKIRKQRKDASDYPYFEGMDSREICSLYVEAAKD